MNNKAYISCPISVSQKYLSDVNEFVRNAGWNPLHWKRGTKYDESSISDYIQSCDAFILILPDNLFGAYISNLPAGCQKELKKAVKANRRIYLAYTSGTGLHIYTASVENDYVKGFSGSSGLTGEFESKGLEFKTSSLTTSTNNVAKIASDVDFSLSGVLSGITCSNSLPYNSMNVGESWTINPQLGYASGLGTYDSPSYLKYDSNIGKVVHEVLEERFYGKLEYEPADRRAALLVVI